MRSRPVLWLLLILLVVGFFWMKDRQKDNQVNQLQPGEQIEAARDKAQPVFLYFRSPTCPACREMQGIVDRLRSDYQPGVAFVTVNTANEENQDLINHYSIKYIPHTFILDSQGDILFNQSGVIAEEVLREQLDGAVQGRFLQELPQGGTNN